MTIIRRKISSKKNVFIAAALIALMAIGSTFAYFVDRDYVTNNFTVGDVEISVSEPNWDPDEGTDITPNKVIKKDPKITNEGVNDAFVFMRVTVPRATVKTANYDGTLNARVNQDLFTFTANSGWKLIKSDNGAFSSEYVYAYAGDKMTVLAPGSSTGTLFDTVTVTIKNKANVSYENNLTVTTNEVTTTLVKVPEIRIVKKIPDSDVQVGDGHGRPTFLFKITGGTGKVWYRSVTFDDEKASAGWTFSKSGGYWIATGPKEKFPEDDYTVTEIPVSRFKEVSSSVMKEGNYREFTFINEKDNWQYFSHKSVVINTLEGGAAGDWR